MHLVQRGLEAIERGRHSTPALFVDPAGISDNLSHLQRSLPDFQLHYAVKCNSGLTVLNAVFDAGAGFEIASIAELTKLSNNGLHADNVVFSAPVKRPSEIAQAASAGVSWFCAASHNEIDKILDAAPASSVMVRVAVDNSTAHWDLSSVWGAPVADVPNLLDHAEAHGARAVGLSFHVGSQNRDPAAWTSAFSDVAEVMERWTGSVDLLNIGGGFPSTDDPEEDRALWNEIGEAVKLGLHRLPSIPNLLLAEPGRAVVASAGVLFTTVVGVDQRADDRFVHIDAGAFNGLHEQSPSGGSLPVTFTAFDRDPQILEPTVVTGITCDSDDIVATDALLPVDLRVGELLAVPNAGAYSTAYASDFCGIGKPTTRRLVHIRQDLAPAEYDVVLPDDAAFEAMCGIEYESFSQSGFLEADGSLSSIRKLDELSRFIVAPSLDEPMGVIRALDSTPYGFLTLAEMEMYPETWKHLRNVDLTTTVECLTLAPLRRKPVTSVHLLRALFQDSLERDKARVICSLDEALLDKIEARYFDSTFEFRRLGPPIDYVGSMTVPVLIDLYDAMRSVQFFDGLGEVATRFPLHGRKSLLPSP